MSRHKTIAREIYSIEVVENGFDLTMRESLFHYFVGLVTKEEPRKTFLGIPKTIVDGLCVLHITLPFIDFSIQKKGVIDWNGLGICAEQVSLLLELLNFCVPEGEQVLDFCLSNDVQLVAIDAYHRKDGGYHANGMRVRFSERARSLLQKEYGEGVDLPSCKVCAGEVYGKLSSETKKEFNRMRSDCANRYGGAFGVRAMVRKKGVPDFAVPGNCACLGANPDNFQYSGEIDSHNLDTSLQQMAMLAAVVTFWNDVLRPLHARTV